MRAGPLSTDSVIEKLNQQFINTSLIMPEFKDPEAFFQNPMARKWAKVIAKEFTYPVDSIVLSSEGNVLAQGEFNDMIRISAYLEMLEKAIK